MLCVNERADGDFDLVVTNGTPLLRIGPAEADEASCDGRVDLDIRDLSVVNVVNGEKGRTSKPSMVERMSRKMAKANSHNPLTSRETVARQSSNAPNPAPLIR